MGGDDWLPTVETFELIGTAPADEPEEAREEMRDATMKQYEKVKAKFEDATAEFRVLEDMERNGSKGVPFAVAAKGPRQRDHFIVGAGREFDVLLGGKVPPRPKRRPPPKQTRPNQLQPATYRRSIAMLLIG